VIVTDIPLILKMH